MVINMASTLSSKGHHVFIDQWFTNLHLIKDLGKHGVAVTGAINKNRIGLPENLATDIAAMSPKPKHDSKF